VTAARKEHGSSEEQGVASDDALMARLKMGDTGALAELYRRHRGVVNAVVCRQVPGLGSGDAEDLCHEVFLELKGLASKYQSGRSLKAWLCGIALKKAWRRSRGQWLRMRLLAGLSAAPKAAPAHERVDAALEVDRLLGQLPPDLREVVVLCLVEQLETAEVAQALGLSVNAVWTRLHRARKLLRELEGGEA
jgi:RNA polymerase sigma factor (sigma-70 family)